MKIGLYVHIPFCHSKCHYCDFLSFTNEGLEESYTDALVKELEHYGEKLKNKHTIKSIFIGGGTPTVLPPFLLDRICSAITRCFRLEKDVEWTIEANPGTIKEAHVAVFKRYPVNRISLGLQASQEHLLKKIGRIHTFKEWEESIRLLKEGGIENINTDLMFALPGQTLEDWKKTLEVVTMYDIQHISAYALIIEEGTRFGDLYEEGKLEEVDEDLDRNMYYYAKEFLKQRGYEHYELSNWSKPNLDCKHNVLYWRREPYIGVGLGSHSFFENTRFSNETNLRRYIATETSDIVVEREVLTKQIAMEEFMFLGLRMLEGVSYSEFENIFGKSLIDVYGCQIQEWIKQKALVQNKDRIYLTDYGLDIANQVFASFIQ
ncbi:MAG: radical SAM family heme chaperone HemW [Cellulosilyticaceae bacterium]